MRHGVSHGAGYSVHPVTRVPYVGARQCAFVGVLVQTLEERVVELQSRLQGTEAILCQLRGEGDGDAET
jgi:hypothetical protein